MTPKTWIAGEFLGTFLLVLFGCGSVATAVACGAQVGIFQVAIVWGFGLTVAIILTGPLSGAHLNPAITLAMVVFRSFPKRQAAAYILIQFLGAFAAASLIYLVYGGVIELFEQTNGIVRGQAGSEASAMIFGEYYPNPSGETINEAARGSVTAFHGFLAEFIGTALLSLVIFGITDKRRKTLPGPAIPFVIGMTLTVLISLLAPISMGGFNPARDLAPRIFSSLAGWGDLPFTLNGSGWFIVYVFAPIAGAICGGFTNQLLPANYLKA
ncbi:MAG: aquaporin [Opitutales bacterium]|nr:aquaporin [Opitutales bacterium]